MPDIVISEFMDEAAVQRLGERYAVLYDADLVDRPQDLAASASDARVLVVRNRTQVRGDLLAACKALTFVGRLGVGLDNIDMGACQARGIEVVPASGANDLSVAEYVVTSAMSLLRGAYAATAAVAAGEWPRQQLVGRELSGKLLGLIGYGAIARDVARRARDLGMTVAAYDPHLDASDAAWDKTERLELDEMLAQADVISLHVPLTPATRHMIAERQLDLMKPDAVLINAARGGVVDEAALAAALRGGRIGGAALDVFETEPLTAAAGAKFKGLANLILTPHIAGVTRESNVRVSDLIASAVLAHLDGDR
ncbi:hydroxyacid dehydrogenase [Nitratireductor mangrovi]|uniref:Hydroxyacid dehydrogenase n=1 Tax=Nitratireductor mangrovi TaxID=2599600 RepID=A0A5B8L4D9_9HYPH|nr:hydroxyacid dehydrogenase [Nitratireductor mangrovi]QDZ02881.1 hydroxyacid dehydrogenase [Nitratireductor mangrovi]